MKAGCLFDEGAPELCLGKKNVSLPHILKNVPFWLIFCEFSQGSKYASMGLPPKVSLNIIAFECMQYSYTNVTVCIFKKRK